MKRTGRSYSFLSSLVHKSVLSTIGLACSIGSIDSLVDESQTKTITQGLNLNFSTFSPAFAALEDEYLFEDTPPSFRLASGESDSTYISLTKKPQAKPIVKKLEVITPLVHISPISVKKPILKPRLYAGFDGTLSLSKIKSDKAWKQNVRQATAIKSPSRTLALEELKFGPLATVVKSQPVMPVSPSQYHEGALGPKAVRKQTLEQSDVTTQAKADETPVIDEYTIHGGIRLTEGLAFIGTMDVAWVVGDYIQQSGSINLPDATYEISATHLVGHIIVSLYDSRDELIGEGILNLSGTHPVDGVVKYDMVLKPVDWDKAGIIISSTSLGTPGKPLKGVNIDLYAFNESVESDSAGVFRFYDWKVTNSRSLAIASKDGYRDSIFMVDSKTLANVALFKDEDIEDLLNSLGEFNSRSLSEKALVLGKIQGQAHLDGYNVRMSNVRPIYFRDANNLDSNLVKTETNGLFAFAGLQDGDYELFIEKDGEIIDQRILVVEQGKVSPVLIDLEFMNKPLTFYDPLDPDSVIEQVDVSFFDGVESISLSKNNIGTTTVIRGAEPSLIDIATPIEITRTLLSRSETLQRIPYLNNEVLLKLAETSEMFIEDGILFGFITSDTPYMAFFLEDQAAKTIYFNSEGEPINPSDEVAHGFIKSGFSDGLSSLIIEDAESQMILATDLIYSDQDSISVLQIDVHSPGS